MRWPKEIISLISPSLKTLRWKVDVPLKGLHFSTNQAIKVLVVDHAHALLAM